MLYYNWVQAEDHTEDPQTLLVWVKQKNQPTRHSTSTSQLTCSNSGPRSPVVSRWQHQTCQHALGTTWCLAQLRECKWMSTGDKGGCASTVGLYSQRSNSETHQGWMETKLPHSQNTGDDKVNFVSTMSINTTYTAYGEYLSIAND